MKTIGLIVKSKTNPNVTKNTVTKEEKKTNPNVTKKK